LFQPAFFRIPPASSCPRPAEHIHRSMPNDGEVGGAVVPSETHVEHPVEAVLGRPVRAHRVGEEVRVQHQGRDEVPRPRSGLLVIVIPDEDDAADAGQILPSGMALPGHPISSHRVHVRVSITPLSPSMD